MSPTSRSHTIAAMVFVALATTTIGVFVSKTKSTANLNSELGLDLGHPTDSSSQKTIRGSAGDVDANNPFFKPSFVINDIVCTLYLAESDGLEQVTETNNVFSDGTQATEDSEEHEHTIVKTNHIEERAWVCGDIVSTDSNDENQHQLNSIMFPDLRSADVDIDDFINSQGAIPGESRLLLSSAVLTPGAAELFIPKDTTIRVDNLAHSTRRKLLPHSGKQIGLMVRVIGSDNKEPNVSTKDLFIETFANDEYLSMSDQIRACSYDKLDIVPYNNADEGINGVVDIKIDIPIIEGVTERSVVTNKASALLRDRFDDPLLDKFDMIQFCLPAGTLSPGGVKEWLGLSLTGNKISFYNDDADWCRSISLKLHEVGHNMNLAHSGEDKILDDRIGAMGLSYTEVGVGFDRICFNHVKGYQLGWYEDQIVDMNPLAEANPVQEFSLVGLHRYTEDKSQVVILRLLTPDLPVTGANDYYIGFNEAEGMVSGVKEDFNNVIIYQKDIEGPYIYGSSTKLTQLGFGQSYIIENYNNEGKEVKISVESLIDGVAKIKVSDVERAPPEKGEDEDSCPDSKYPVKLELLPDMYPDDVIWSIEDTATGTTVAYGKDYKVKWQADTDVEPDTRLLCLPYGTEMVFIIMDLFDDGICCLKGSGYYKAIGPDGETLFAGGSEAKPPYTKQYQKEDRRVFTSPPSNAPPTEAPVPVPTTQPDPTANPTGTPTATPTAIPTATPTATPTVAPVPDPTPTPNPPSPTPLVPEPGTCTDSVNFEYQGKDCNWVYKQKKSRCKLLADDGETKLADFCPKKCKKKCEGNNPNPKPKCKNGKRQFKVNSEMVRCTNFAKKGFTCDTQAKLKGKTKTIKQICKKACEAC